MTLDLPPGRSAAYAGESMIATAHPMATAAGANVFRSGGNAVDAAIAAAAMLAVVEPAMSGIGGDCFALVARGRDRSAVTAINGSGQAPLAARAGDPIVPYSPTTVTLPGAVAAWDRLVADHGTWPFAELLQPALGAARDGFVVTPRVAFDWQLHASVLRRHPGAAAVFLPGNRAPRAGERVANPELARCLEHICRDGASGLYQGPVAEAIVRHLRSLGGVHDLEDMANVAPEYVDPINTGYRGYTVHECPPNGAGVTALMMLNILSGYDLAAYDPAGTTRLHLEIEAGRLARADRDASVADPRHHDVPVSRLLSAQHADSQRARIDLDHVIGDVQAPEAVRPAPHTDTTYVCAVDGDRTAISLICSVFGPFGSGIVPPGTGVVLQNRGLGFSTDPMHPNCIAGGKRPLHTILPALVTQRLGDADRIVMALGVMGGHYQPVGQCHVLTNIVDYSMDPQQAIDFPRAHHDEDVVVIERSYGREVDHGLRRLGHRTRTSDEPIGGGQAIVVDDHLGCLVGGSDRRKDGVALGWR